MDTTYNFEGGSMIGENITNCTITNNYNNSSSIDWELARNEVAKLQRNKSTLSSEAQDATDELANAVSQQNESMFVTACKSIGAVALVLIQDLGLQLIQRYV